MATRVAGVCRDYFGSSSLCFRFGFSIRNSNDPKAINAQEISSKLWGGKNHSKMSLFFRMDSNPTGSPRPYRGGSGTDYPRGVLRGSAIGPAAFAAVGEVPRGLPLRNVLSRFQRRLEKHSVIFLPPCPSESPRRLTHMDLFRVAKPLEKDIPFSA